jgi:hypothetical protein
MAYVKTNWVNGLTSVNSTNLNKIEVGIDEAHQDVATKAPLTRSITAGNGITGGGSLELNRTLTLGTPTTVTINTTNNVTSDSHTHALTITKADIGLGNVDNVQQEPKSLRGQLSISAFSSWTSGSYGPYSFRRGVAISGVVATDTPIIEFTLSTIQIARTNDISYFECYNGGVYFYAKTIPNDTVTYNYRIIRG